MTTMVRGSETTANVNTSQHVRDVSSRLRYLDPEAAPFTLILNEESSAEAENFKFEWPEKVLPPKLDQVNGTTGTGTSIIVDNSEYFRVGDLVKVARTGEVMRVTAVTTATDTLTVERAVGSTTVAAVANNDDLFILGSAYAEGAAVGSEKTHQESWIFNYTQIFRTPFGASGTQSATRSYLGNNRTRLRKEAAVEHRIDMERSFLFGERNRDVTDTGAPRSYTGGILYWATSNAKAAGGTLTEPEIWDWCEDLFAHTAGGSSRTLFASALVCTVIDLLAGARLQTVPSDRTFGIAVKEWVTSHGTLMVVKHRLLENGAGATGYAGYGLGLAMRSLKYRYLTGRNTKLMTDRQSPGDDRWTDEYLTECGLEFSNPELHGVLSGCTG